VNREKDRETERRNVDLNEEGKMKGITGQRKSLRRGSKKDEKDEKKEYAEGEEEGGGRETKKHTGVKQTRKGTHKV
jgi:hypothetical protein